MDFSGKQFPKEVIIMAVRWYLSYGVSYRNVEELVQDWNISLDHATVQRWVVEYDRSWKIKFENTLLETLSVAGVLMKPTLK